MLLSADRPIEDASEDSLGVKDFAHALADSIARMVPSNGFVIALPGEWGSGKSSILNLVERRIIHQEMANWTSSGIYQEDDKLAPLNVEDIEERATAFKKVAEISQSYIDPKTECLSGSRSRRLQSFEAAGLSKNEAIAAEDYLRIRQQLRSQPQTIILRFNPWWFSGQENLFRAFFSELASLLPKAAGDRLKESMRSLARRFAGIGSVAASAAATIVPLPGVKESGNIFDRWMQRWGNKDKGLTDAKNDLAAALRRRSHKVLVIIDDIDRLLPFEAFQIFTLIKSVGDLPNVVYLLAYDQARITSMLKEPPLKLDPEFLEKIVQYEVPVPILDPASLPSLLDKSLNAILPPVPESKQDEYNRRIGSAYFNVLRDYLRQPRDIGRLSNALQVAMANLAGQVDTCDFIVLETLRLFDNEAYLAVRDNLGRLTGEEPAWGRDSEIAAELKARLTKCRNPKIAEQAVGSLFPQASKEWKVYSGYHKGHAEDAGDRRICIALYARTYFSLVPLPHLFSSKEIEELFDSANPKALLERMVQKTKSGKGPKGLSRIPTLIQQIADHLSSGASISSTLARAIFDESEEIIRIGDEDPEMFGGGNNTRRLEFLILRWIRGLDESTRYEVLKPIVEHTSGITMASLIARSLGPDKRPEGSTKERTLMSDEQIESIRSIVLTRLKRMASDTTFWEAADPTALLWTWWAIGEENEAQKWIATQIKNQRALFRLIAAMPQLVRSSEGNYFSVSKEMWGKFVNVDSLTEQAEQYLATGNTSSPGQEIVRRFLKAVQRGKER